MKICVLIKQVPDKDSPLTIAEDNLSLVENNITWVSNESDNYALEEALQLKEKCGGEVVACTLGNESARQIPSLMCRQPPRLHGLLLKLMLPLKHSYHFH